MHTDTHPHMDRYSTQRQTSGYRDTDGQTYMDIHIQDTHTDRFLDIETHGHRWGEIHPKADTPICAHWDA